MDMTFLVHLLFADLLIYMFADKFIGSFGTWIFVPVVGCGSFDIWLECTIRIMSKQLRP